MLTAPDHQPSRRLSKRLSAVLAAAALVAIPVFAPVLTTAAAQAAPEENTVTVADTRTQTSEARASELVGLWLELWNGDYRGTERFIRPDFRVHAALTGGGDGSSIRGPEGLVAWVKESRTAVPNLEFVVEVGPIVQGDLLVVRWLAEGTYPGGIPGATAPAGTRVSFTGTDILRLEGGRLAEYWINSDTLLLLTQLGVVPGGS